MICMAPAVPPLDIIAWREIYTYLEKCADTGEHIADVVESVVMKTARTLEWSNIWETLYRSCSEKSFGVITMVISIAVLLVFCSRLTGLIPSIPFRKPAGALAALGRGGMHMDFDGIALNYYAKWYIPIGI